jgi:ABC-type multidrug transport system fused ATPase/permease subunit
LLILSVINGIDLMKGRTTIMVAHRLSTVRDATRIYVFNKGSIVEQGSHDELVVKADGIYAAMWNAQSQKVYIT